MEQKVRLVEFWDRKNDFVKLDEVINNEMKDGWFVKQITPLASHGGGTRDLLLLFEKQQITENR